MFWIATASAVYVLVGVGCYFHGFRLIKQLRDALGPLANWGIKNERPSLFEPPQSRPVEIFFKGLGIFLVVAGVVLFFVMMRLPRG